MADAISVFFLYAAISITASITKQVPNEHQCCHYFEIIPKNGFYHEVEPPFGKTE